MARCCLRRVKRNGPSPPRTFSFRAPSRTSPSATSGRCGSLTGCEDSRGSPTASAMTSTYGCSEPNATGSTRQRSDYATVAALSTRSRPRSDEPLIGGSAPAYEDRSLPAHAAAEAVARRYGSGAGGRPSTPARFRRFNCAASAPSRAVCSRRAVDLRVIQFVARITTVTARTRSRRRADGRGGVDGCTALLALVDDLFLADHGSRDRNAGRLSAERLVNIRQALTWNFALRGCDLRPRPKGLTSGVVAPGRSFSVKAKEPFRGSHRG